MSAVVRRSAATELSLSALYAPIQDELAAAERILRDEMRSEFPCVDELVRYGVLLGGKRLRPALLLLTAKAVGNITAEHLVLAAVVEMIHTATLVHDDVLDDAERRRHLATVSSRWDNKSAVLLGDFLFTHSFYLASTTESTWACRVIGRATNTVCEGEMRQKGSIGDFAMTEAEYLAVISAKTGELCACSCELGAYYAGGSAEQVQRLAAFGQDLGIAFQIVDDILDLDGDEHATGKSLGTDLAQQKPTLPLIRLLERSTSSERDDVLAILNGNAEERLPALRSHLRRHDALNYARDKAQEFARRANRQLESMAPSPARETLSAMSQFVVGRTR